MDRRSAAVNLRNPGLPFVVFPFGWGTSTKQVFKLLDGIAQTT